MNFGSAPSGEYKPPTFNIIKGDAKKEDEVKNEAPKFMIPTTFVKPSPEVKKEEAPKVEEIKKKEESPDTNGE